MWRCGAADKLGNVCLLKYNVVLLLSTPIYFGDGGEVCQDA